MPFRLYLMGHGAYEPNDGFFPVPRGFFVHFYVDHAKQLPKDSLKPILWGEMQPTRTIGEFRECPNYTWLNGKPTNWSKFVTQGDAQRAAPNANLPLAQRDLTWDVRYVQYFKAGATGVAPTPIQAQQVFTLKDLLEPPHAYFSVGGKTGPFEIHVLLCSVVKLTKTELGVEMGLNALEFQKTYLHRNPISGGQRITSRAALGETAYHAEGLVDAASLIARGHSQLALSEFAQDPQLTAVRPDWAYSRNCGMCGHRYKAADKFCRECGSQRPP